jgi:hypothetical protein
VATTGRKKENISAHLWSTDISFRERIGVKGDRAV